LVAIATNRLKVAVLALCWSFAAEPPLGTFLLEPTTFFTLSEGCVVGLVMVPVDWAADSGVIGALDVVVAVTTVATGTNW